MSDKVLSASDLEKILDDKDRHIILHNIDGEIIGASSSVCKELGYNQDEIVQMLLANIKASALRLSDVCTDHKGEDAPVIFQRRNGRRFAAHVKSQVLQASIDRAIHNIVQLELDILQGGTSTSTEIPRFDLQESADYLQLLSQELQTPLTTIGVFLEGLQTQDDVTLDSNKLAAALAARQELSELANDVVDWFKIGINLLTLDKQPFNLIGLLDKLTVEASRVCSHYGVEFSLCIDNRQRELVFGDTKRLKQLLNRIIAKLNNSEPGGQLRLQIASGRGDHSRNHVVFTLTRQYEPGSVNQQRSETDSDDTSLGIINKLITVMGGDLKTQAKSVNEFEYCFHLLLPDVDMLDIEGDTQFLANSKVLLVDEHNSLIKLQLSHWGAEVESFSNLEQAVDYLSQLSNPPRFDLTVCYCDTESNEPLEGLRNSNNTSPILSIKQCEDYVLDNKGLSEAPAPPQPGVLGNALAVLMEKPLPYPYCRNQQDRFLNLNDLRKRILFVDDVETIRLTFRAMLEKASFEVDLAHNGIDAILACTQRKYDAIVVDIQMPYMDGLEASNHIRKSNNFNTETPILAVSGDTSDNTRVLAERSGIQDILAKPVAMEDLLQNIHYLINEYQVSTNEMEDDRFNELLLTPGRRANEVQAGEEQSSRCLNADLLNGLIEDTSLETCMEMIEIFMQESKRSVRIIDQESHHKNWNKVMHEAHAIKSTSYTFGCEALYNISTKLEAEIENSEHLKCEQTVDEMAAVFSESYVALEEFFKHAQATRGSATP